MKSLRKISLSLSFFYNYFYLAALDLSCSMWDLVPWLGIEPGPPALGAQRIRHQTTREVPTESLKGKCRRCSFNPCVRKIPGGGNGNPF